MTAARKSPAVAWTESPRREGLGLKALVKNGLGWLVSTPPLNALLLRRTGVVVAFHRVQDGADPIGLSIGREMFERQCRFFQRHFRVIPLGEFVGRLVRGESLDRHLAITFDDGYRDNFENAMPILSRLSLPAAFFVVSGWIGTDAWPWWDRDQRVRHRWMTWDHVRELADRGFEIGAHTRTHADLGVTAGTAARDEIFGAKADLESRLARPVDLFAYPYGRKNNMTGDNRALVKAAGFRCCCSSVGGLTPTGADPFHMHRFAVSPWYGSPQQVGLELVRERLAAAC